MKANYLFSSLCFAPLALAAPISHRITMVTGKAIWKPGHQIITFLEEVQHVVVTKQPSPHASTSSKKSPFSIVDVEQPATTAELMQLSSNNNNNKSPSQPIIAPPQHIKSPRPKAAKPGGGSKKISVGALVVPSGSSSSSSPIPIGAFASIFDPETSPYLIPGQYVASQRADVLIVGLILACVLAVIAIESWELVSSLVSSGIFRREGRIRLVDDDTADVERTAAKEWDSDSEDDCNAPFGGFRKHSHRIVEETGLRLPEKVDEKEDWI